MSKLGVETNPGLQRVFVDTKFNKLGVETNPGVYKVAVDTKLSKFGEETTLKKLLRYPDVPNPATVETNFSCVTSPEINPKEVDNDDIAAAIELFIDNVETYPLVASPVTVDVMIDISTPPGPKKVEKLEIA